MKKILSAIFCLAMTAQIGFSQDLEYETVSDDPGKAMSQLYIGIEPVFFDMNGINKFAMGFGLYGHYHVKQNLMFQARMQTPYWRGILDMANLATMSDRKANTLFNDYNPKQLMYIDLNASLKLLRKDRPHRPVVIPLGNGGEINNYIDGAYATKRYQLMARAGVLMRNSTVTLKNVPAEANWGGSSNFYTNMTSTSIYAGVSINKMWELVANITELDIGKEIARMHKSYYVDLMFAPILDVKDLSKGGKTVPIVGDDTDNGYVKKNRLGARIGVANMPEYKNNLTGWELGIFPSVVGNGNSGFFFKWWWILDVYSSDKS